MARTKEVARLSTGIPTWKAPLKTSVKKSGIGGVKKKARAFCSRKYQKKTTERKEDIKEAKVQDSTCDNSD